MRRWGTVISVVYALIVLGLLVPGAVLISGAVESNWSWTNYLGNVGQTYQEVLTWVPIVMVLAGQILLLFLSVDTTWKRLKPRRHIATACVMTGGLTALLSCGAIWSVGFATRGDHFWEYLFDNRTRVLGFLSIVWLIWGVVFFVYFRNSSLGTTRMVSWLLRGSVLELLIAVPCHIIVRRRQDCCAPIMTSFGIATGIAIMLLSFGPSVLLLYKKRLDAYEKGRPADG